MTFADPEAEILCLPFQKRLLVFRVHPGAAKGSLVGGLGAGLERAFAPCAREYI